MSEILTLEYNLAELPSSQHRAGLAGLVLMVDWLKGEIEKDELDAEKVICRRLDLDETKAVFEINQEGCKYLFDKVYGFYWKTIESENKPTGKNAKFTEKIIDGKTIYTNYILQPQGAFLADYDSTIENNKGLWINLWRDMLFKVIRADYNPKLPFENRAKGLEDKTTIEMWNSLQKTPKKGIAISHSLFLTAQGKNAEDVPFKDCARFHFLLHFWAFVAQIYVPMTTKYDKKKEQEEVKFVGYSLTIPDVSNLKVFCAKLPKILRGRSDKKLLYYPKESVVDIAAEGALDFMHKLNQILPDELLEVSIGKILLGIDVFHVEKPGNSVRFLGATRINPVHDTSEYITVKNSYNNPLFRRQRMLNVLNERKDKFYGFDSLLSKTNSEQTIGSSSFRSDVKKAFEDIGIEIKKGEKLMNTETQETVPKTIESLIYQLVDTFIRAKLKSKYQLEWKKTQGTNQESEYQEKKAKIARESFLAIRSRTNSDFIDYFASTLCAFPQFLNEQGYATLAKALYTETDKVRTLTMLALSARG